MKCHKFLDSSFLFILEPLLKYLFLESDLAFVKDQLASNFGDNVTIGTEAIIQNLGECSKFKNSKILEA